MSADWPTPWADNLHCYVKPMHNPTAQHIEIRPGGEVYSTDFQDVLFSATNGLAETTHVFLEGNNLPVRFAATKRSFTIGELGFGTGLNFLATWRLFRAAAPPQASLDFVSIEKHPIPAEDLLAVLKHWPALSDLSSQLVDAYDRVGVGWNRFVFDDGRVRLTLCVGDVQQVLPELTFAADAWFLDGFAPAKNETMWTEHVLGHVSRLTAIGGTVATYTAAGHVRRRLRDAGFDVERSPGFAEKRHMTRGVKRRPSPVTITIPPWLRYSTNKYAALTRHDQNHAIIIGAGLAGCAAARALADRGWRVTMLDRAGVAGGASGNECAIFAPRFSANDQSPYAQYCTTAFHIASNTLLRFAADIELQWHDIEIAAGSPTAEHVAGGTVNAAEFCKALIDHEDITLRSRETAARLEHTDNIWRTTCTTGNEHRAPIVIIANAAAASSIGQLAWLPITPLRGQTTLLPATPESRTMLTAIHMLDDGYITPADARGLHTLGATFDRDDDSDDLRHADNVRNLDRLRTHAPELAHALRVDAIDPKQFACWAGVRATLPDRLPAVGPVPDHAAFTLDYADVHHGRATAHHPDATWLPGLFCSVGHGSRGVVSSVLAAEVLASMIEHTPAPSPLSMLHAINPARFIMRELKRAPAHRTGNMA